MTKEEKEEKSRAAPKGPAKFVFHTLGADTDYKSWVTNIWYKIYIGRPFLVTDPRDIEFFESQPQRFKRVPDDMSLFHRIGQVIEEIKEKASGQDKKEFEYFEWLKANYRDDIATFVKQKYPTIEGLKKATVSDLINIRGVGRINAEKIFNAVQILKI